ncbi:MAG: hypothetical protein RL685_796, partial [Pseudomonadota bacterium]
MILASNTGVFINTGLLSLPDGGGQRVYLELRRLLLEALRHSLEPAQVARLLQSAGESDPLLRPLLDAAAPHHGGTVASPALLFAASSPG